MRTQKQIDLHVPCPYCGYEDVVRLYSSQHDAYRCCLRCSQDYMLKPHDSGEWRLFKLEFIGMLQPVKADRKKTALSFLFGQV